MKKEQGGTLPVVPETQKLTINNTTSVVINVSIDLSFECGWCAGVL